MHGKYLKCNFSNLVSVGSEMVGRIVVDSCLTAHIVREVRTEVYVSVGIAHKVVGLEF